MGALRRQGLCSYIGFSAKWGPGEGKGYVAILISHHGDPRRKGLCSHSTHTWGVLLDPCAHHAYFWVLFITQIQNACFFFHKIGFVMVVVDVGHIFSCSLTIGCFFFFFF